MRKKKVFFGSLNRKDIREVINWEFVRKPGSNNFRMPYSFSVEKKTDAVVLVEDAEPIEEPEIHDVEDFVVIQPEKKEEKQEKEKA